MMMERQCETVADPKDDANQKRLKRHHQETRLSRRPFAVKPGYRVFFTEPRQTAHTFTDDGKKKYPRACSGMPISWNLFFIKRE